MCSLTDCRADCSICLAQKTTNLFDISFVDRAKHVFRAMSSVHAPPNETKPANGNGERKRRHTPLVHLPRQCHGNARALHCTGHAVPTRLILITRKHWCPAAPHATPLLNAQVERSLLPNYQTPSAAPPKSIERLSRVTPPTTSVALGASLSDVPIGSKAHQRPLPPQYLQGR